MVALIVRYRGALREATNLLEMLLKSDTCYINNIQKEIINLASARYREHIEDYTTLVDDEED